MSFTVRVPKMTMCGTFDNRAAPLARCQLKLRIQFESYYFQFPGKHKIAVLLKKRLKNLVFNVVILIFV